MRIDCDNSHVGALRNAERFLSDPIGSEHSEQNEQVDYYIGDQTPERSFFVKVLFYLKLISALGALCLSWWMVSWGWWQVCFDPIQRGNIGLVVCFASAIPMFFAFWLFLG